MPPKVSAARVAAEAELATYRRQNSAMDMVLRELAHDRAPNLETTVVLPDGGGEARLRLYRIWSKRDPKEPSDHGGMVLITAPGEMFCDEFDHLRRAYEQRRDFREEARVVSDGLEDLRLQRNRLYSQADPQYADLWKNA